MLVLMRIIAVRLWNVVCGVRKFSSSSNPCIPKYYTLRSLRHLFLLFGAELFISYGHLQRMAALEN